MFFPVPFGGQTLSTSVIPTCWFLIGRPTTKLAKRSRIDASTPRTDHKHSWHPTCCSCCRNMESVI